MWIRSQDKNRLLDIDKFFIDGVNIKYLNCLEKRYYIIGTYATKERALEVLDEIQEVIENGYETFTNKEKWNSNSNTYGLVYEMPKE